jgi:serine/threonine-protein kinase TNNI3K
VQFVVIAAYRTILMGCFLYLFCRPLSRASVRTQQELCLFALVYYILVYVYSIFFYDKDYHNGMMLVFCAVVWATFGPFFVWRLLKADTEHWRGLSDRACDFQQLFRENQGMQEIVSAQGLHVMLEMHRKDVIDFAVSRLPGLR